MSRDIDYAYDCKICGVMFSVRPLWDKCPVCGYADITDDWFDGGYI